MTVVCVMSRAAGFFQGIGLCDARVSPTRADSNPVCALYRWGAVAGVVEIEGGVISGLCNEQIGAEAPTGHRQVARDEHALG